MHNICAGKAWPFLQPVDPEMLNIPDYFDIIENPMDLSSVTARLHLPPQACTHTYKYICTQTIYTCMHAYIHVCTNT